MLYYRPMVNDLSNMLHLKSGTADPYFKLRKLFFSDFKDTHFYLVPHYILFLERLNKYTLRFNTNFLVIDYTSCVIQVFTVHIC